VLGAGRQCYILLDLSRSVFEFQVSTIACGIQRPINLEPTRPLKRTPVLLFNDGTGNGSSAVSLALFKVVVAPLGRVNRNQKWQQSWRVLSDKSLHFDT
jgi:hypothetical protein